MSSSPSTAWEMIAQAAAGDTSQRKAFAERYGEMIRFLLWSRWRNRRHASNIEDAMQDVFVECFKQGGVLESAGPGHVGRFRSYLQGVVHHVALRHEERVLARQSREPQHEGSIEEIAGRQRSPSRMMDRELALRLIREAAALLQQQAAEKGGLLPMRVEILRMRFQEGLPIREIAVRMDKDTPYVHHQYAKARGAFRRALFEVVGSELPGSAEHVRQTCRQLLDLLG